MSLFDLELAIFFALDFDSLGDDLKFAPLVINEVFGLIFVELFLPEVSRIDARSRQAPSDIVGPTDADHWGAWQLTTVQNSSIWQLEMV